MIPFEGLDLENTMKKITDDTFDELVLEADKPVVVDFYTPTCGPCRLLSPILEQLSKSRDDVIFFKLDASASADVADDYNISAVPTLLLFQNGEVIDEMAGLCSKDDLIEWIDENIS